MSTPESNDPAGITQIDEVAGEAQAFQPAGVVHEAQPYVPPAEAAPAVEGDTAAPMTAEGQAAEAAAVGDDAAIAAVKDESTFNFPAPEPRNNATLSVAYSKPVADNEWVDLATTIALPADTTARTLNYGETQPNPQLADGEKGEKWAEVVALGMQHGSYHDNMLPAAKREGADFQQRVKFGDTVLSIGAPRIKDDDGPLLTGERGMLRINAILGRGAIISVPLWHSGFWVTVKMPEETELLDTFDRIIGSKIDFGRNSNGLAFANHAVIDNEAVLDLAMRCLYETSVAGLTSITKIRSMIKAPDIHILAWGLACAMHPRGFQFERSILDPKGAATVVVRENLNVGSCLWVDQSSLDEWQIAHMAKRSTGSMSEDLVKQYTERFVRGANKTLALNDKLALTLRVPSADEFIFAGRLWVDELAAAVTEAFTQDLSQKQRNEMIWDRARATSMRQFVHWIESIDVTGYDKKMIDREWITKTVASLSADNEIRDRYYAVMKEYINDSTVALIGVPQVHPKEADQVLPRFENIIPLDPISVFSSLLSQKIQQIRLRP